MEKNFSTRLDESVIQRIDYLSETLGTSKKSIIEKAVTFYSSQIEQEKNHNWLDQTCGAWDRDETPEETINSIRKSFHKSMTRHQK